MPPKLHERANWTNALCNSRGRDAACRHALGSVGWIRASHPQERCRCVNTQGRGHLSATSRRARIDCAWGRRPERRPCLMPSQRAPKRGGAPARESRKLVECGPRITWIRPAIPLRGAASSAGIHGGLPSLQMTPTDGWSHATPRRRNRGQHEQAGRECRGGCAETPPKDAGAWVPAPKACVFAALLRAGVASPAL